jgi:hypothetical protein
LNAEKSGSGSAVVTRFFKVIKSRVFGPRRRLANLQRLLFLHLFSATLRNLIRISGYLSCIPAIDTFVIRLFYHKFLHRVIKKELFPVQ